MLPAGRGGVAAVPGTSSFAPPSERVIGNQLPPWTGSHTGPLDRPAPSPRSPGYVIGGQTGDTDGFSGADPSRAKMQPSPRVVRLGAEQETVRRYGIIGFNDQLQVRDRHVYWDRGRQRTGLTGMPWGLPNTYNPDKYRDGARPDLRAVNISLNPQIGSDKSRSQDDLSRPYTWLGQQDGSVQPVYGGVPGLWQSYGNRGLSRNIHDPSGGEGGPAMVRSGPPHGLHSDTLPSGKQIADRYKVTPQMRPVRFDRPDNSRVAGQSYSQTVQMQGQTGPGTAGQHSMQGVSVRVGGRGWAGV